MISNLIGDLASVKEGDLKTCLRQLSADHAPNCAGTQNEIVHELFDHPQEKVD
jgi:hypothetical protein